MANPSMPIPSRRYYPLSKRESAFDELEQFGGSITVRYFSHYSWSLHTEGTEDKDV